MQVVCVSVEHPVAPPQRPKTAYQTVQVTDSIDLPTLLSQVGFAHIFPECMFPLLIQASL